MRSKSIRTHARSFSCILITVCLFVNTLSAKDSTSVNYGRLYLIGGLSAAGFALSYGLQNNVWWKGKRSKFHFNWEQDWKADLGSDKFGHLYFSNLVANIYSQAFDWAGMKTKQSRFYGGAVALLHQTFTEVRDGFSEDFGFSWGDYAFNIIGAAYPYLQSQFTILKRFNFKISYEASGRFKDGSHSSIIDDYESTYNWLSIDINKFLPNKIDRLVPDFVNLAIGHSVTNLDFNPQHQFYIGLDWNLEGLPGDGWLWKLLKKNLNFYHLPAPAIKIYPNVVWYGLKL